MSADKIEPTFKKETIKEIVKMKFSDPKTKITDDAVCVLTEMLRLATVESVLRAGVQASREASDYILIHHIEKIVAQLILDL
ncbi:centromere protein X-like [Lycorma delicatula]|uniref:centromere protein X-like n=1 Tax=Lycorma delicatula TaxID=130591 RepID=UPI003F51616C